MNTAHPELLALLHACKQEPQDDVPRLVLSDWLEEHGETTRAQLIRLQCRAMRMSHREQRHQRTSQHIRRLEEACARWVRPLREIGLAVAFKRGLLNVTAPIDACARLAAQQRADADLWIWVDSVALHGNRWGLPGLRRWLSPGWLRGVVTLTLHSMTLDPPEATALAEADLPLLRELSVYSQQVSNAALSRLGQSPLARDLRSLSLPRDSPPARFGTNAAVALASGTWDQLRELTLSNHRIVDAGAEALAGTAWFSRLTSLRVEMNNIGPFGIRSLLAGPRALAVGNTHIIGNPIGDEGAAVVAAAPSLAAVERLDLVQCSIGPDGASALSASPHIVHLKSLNLWANRIGDGGAAALARSPHLQRLAVLYLNDNGIGDAGARALAESTHLGKLECLWLHDNTIGETGRRLLRDRFGRHAML